MSRRRSGLTVVCLLWALAGVPGAALAQATPPEPPVPPASQGPPLAPEVLQARQLVKEGNDLYRLSKFDEALVVYERAYKLHARPGTLFNVAQCHRQLGRLDRALFLYRQYLRSSPSPNHRAVAEGIIAQLEQQLRPAPVLPRADAATAAPPAASHGAGADQPPIGRPWYRRWYVWTAVAVVVIGGAVGGAVAATRGSGAPATAFGEHTFSNLGGQGR